MIPRKFSESCWFYGSLSFQFHSFQNRNRSFRWQQFHFKNQQDWGLFAISDHSRFHSLYFKMRFKMILLPTEWPVKILKRMKLKRGTTTKSAWFGELSWCYNFIHWDISKWYCSQLILSVWELSISAFLEVMSTHRNGELNRSLVVAESDDLTFGFCVWENEIRIYSRLIAFL